MSRAQAGSGGLDPSNRVDLSVVLVPPPGHYLDELLATSYSLDLVTMLSLPILAAGRTPRAREDGEFGSPDVGQIIASVDAMTVLCQSDKVRVGAEVDPAYLALIEGCVVPCHVDGGSFHPKLVFVRYRDSETGQPHRRLILATRNLMPDDSWDVCLVLDESSRAGGILLPGISDEIESLAEFALPGHRDRTQVVCQRFGREFADVRFEALPGLRDLRFAVLRPDEPGDGKHLDGDDLLVISPFVGADLIKGLARDRRGQCHLISRPAEVPMSVFKSGVTTWRLIDTASDIGSVPASESPAPSTPTATLRGLHAKVYIASRGATSNLVVTSANATTHGWSRNVEAAIYASTRELTVTSLLAESPKEEPGFRELLVELEEADAKPVDAVKPLEAALYGNVCQDIEVNVDPETQRYVIALRFASALDSGTVLTAQVTGCAWTAVLTSSDGVTWSGTGEFPVHDPPRTGWLRLVLTLEAETYDIYVLARLAGLAYDHVEQGRRTLQERHRDGMWAALADQLGIPGQRNGSEDGDDVSPAAPGAGRGQPFHAIPPVLERLLLRSTREDTWRMERARLRHLVAALDGHPLYPELMSVWRLVDPDE